MPSITDAFQKVYVYIISAAGFLALATLIWAGVLYLTSSGKPENIAKAKKQILGVFVGIIILLGSYIILRTINPELVKIDLPRLKQIIFHPLEAPAEQEMVPAGLLAKTREIAKKVKEQDIPGLEMSSQKINDLTDNCSCENLQSLCACSGGGAGDSCQPIQCYAGPGFQPCPEEKEIKENQQNIIAWKDEILYYRNRANAEAEDLREEIKKILDEQIVYYMKSEQIEENEQVKEYLKGEREKITEEKNLKKSLATNLEELTKLIDKIAAPASEIGQLPNQCLINVKDTNICKPACKGECHDTETGCQPDKCSGDNPCPTDEIQSQLDDIKNLSPQIVQTCDQIIDIVDQIIKFKTILVQP